MIDTHLFGSWNQLAGSLTRSQPSDRQKIPYQRSLNGVHDAAPLGLPISNQDPFLSFELGPITLSGAAVSCIPPAGERLRVLFLPGQAVTYERPRPHTVTLCAERLSFSDNLARTLRPNFGRGTAISTASACQICWADEIVNAGSCVEILPAPPVDQSLWSTVRFR